MAMSDAQLPPDADDGESDPSLQSGVRLSETGALIAARPATPRDAAPEDAPVSASAAGEVNDGAHESPPRSPTSQTTPPTPTSDDLQPMLDLGLPDVPSQGPSPLPDVITLTAEPIDPPAVVPSPEIVEPHDAGSTAFSSELEPAGQPPQSHADEAPSTADVRVEISPIFSALDAAERSAAAAPQSEPPPALDASDTGILLPLSRLSDDAEENLIDVSLQSPETAAIDHPEGDAASDPVPAPEAAIDLPPYPAAPPQGAEEHAYPPEALQDAAARIAAEASATAAALENLKRLLVHKLPEPSIPVAPPEPEEKAEPEHRAPPPIPVYRPPAQVPVTPPPMIAPPLAPAPLSAYAEAPLRRRTGAAVGSFMAGFALSWVFGAVLYVFLTAG